MNDQVKAALEEIAELQPRALGYIKANGFVWEDKDAIGTEAGNWQHLAFSLYSDLCLANSLAHYVMAHAKDPEDAEWDFHRDGPG